MRCSAVRELTEDVSERFVELDEFCHHAVDDVCLICGSLSDPPELVMRMLRCLLCRVYCLGRVKLLEVMLDEETVPLVAVVVAVKSACRRECTSC